jgi:hypothetical protein
VLHISSFHPADGGRRLAEALQHRVGDLGRDLRGHEVLSEAGVEILADRLDHLVHRGDDQLEHHLLGPAAGVEGFLHHPHRLLTVGVVDGLVVGRYETRQHRWDLRRGIGCRRGEPRRDDPVRQCGLLQRE